MFGITIEKMKENNVDYGIFFICKDMNNSEIRSVLFLGIGGVSMHQLACAFQDLGLMVYGYDMKASRYTKICEDRGIKVVHKFDKSLASVDLCVKTGAIRETDKYIRFLRKENVKIIDRAEALGWICRKYSNVIAVAGTHGKSTTASLIYQMLRADGRKVSCHIGADVDGARFNVGDEYLVVEACEYNKSFLSIYPNVSVITNVEEEHMDSYTSMFDLRSSFIKFIKRARMRFVFNGESTKFLRKYKNIEFVENTLLKSKLHGEYNQHNISLAVAVARRLGVDEISIKRVLNSFTGVPRRYELIGKIGRAKAYIDYAHHPTELKAFLDTFAQDYPNNLVVFQPHTYSRTKRFINEFIEILSSVKNLIIYKEYPARENRSQGKSAKELYELVNFLNPNVKYAGNMNGLIKNLGEFDAISFVGAGDIDIIARKIIKTNQKNT